MISVGGALPEKLDFFCMFFFFRGISWFGMFRAAKVN